MADEKDLKNLSTEKLKDTVVGATPEKQEVPLTSSTEFPHTDLSAQEYDESIRNATRLNGFGDTRSATTLSYFGHNHRGMGNPVPKNTERYGLTFFTRPELNLSYDNIIQDRTFTNLLNEQEFGVMRAVRAMLDPDGNYSDDRIARKLNTGKVITGDYGYPSPLVDQDSPFMTLLSNNLITISGWPDPYVDSFISDEGIQKEKWGMIDGVAKIYNDFTLSATFRNIVDDPITKIFHYWTQYASFVYQGKMSPRLHNLVDNRIDYQTRIYRLITDITKEKVLEIAATGAAYPTTNNLGRKFDFQIDRPYNEDLDQIQVQFQCFGAIYNDPILIWAFNRTQQRFNVHMRDNLRNERMIKLVGQEKSIFNYYGYPRINPDTMELEWWIDKVIYKEILGSVIKTNPGSINMQPSGSSADKLFDALKDPTGAAKDKLQKGVSQKLL